MPDDFPRTFIGASHGLTPTLDRLATEGVTFERAYTTAPLCSPSRYCVVTGRHASTGVMRHGTAPKGRANPERGMLRDIAFNNLGIDPSHGTLASSLGRLGYETAFVGKWHLGERSSSKWRPGEPQSDEVASDESNAEEVRRVGGYGWASDVYYDNDAMDRSAHQPEWMAAEATRWLRWVAARRRPFFLHMAPTVTHSPLMLAQQLLARPRASGPEGGAPPPLPGDGGGSGAGSGANNGVDLASFERETAALRLRLKRQLLQAGVLCEGNGTVAQCEKQLPELAKMLVPQHWLPLPTLQPWEAPARRYAPAEETACRVRLKGKNHDMCQNFVHFSSMLGYAAWLDATLQPLVALAEQAGSAAGGGTLVIFTSDHGDGYTDKGSVYEPGIRVPLMMHHLGTSGGGARWRRAVRVTAPVTHLDLRPTLLALATGAEGASATAGTTAVTAATATATASTSSSPAAAASSSVVATSELSRSLHPLLQVEYKPSSPIATALEASLERRPIYVEIGYSRALLSAKWKLIVTPPPPPLDDGTRAPCTNNHGDSMDSYLRELVRIGAAAAAVGADAQPYKQLAAVSTARKGMDRSSQEVRLLYSSFLRHPASYCDAVQLFDTEADPAEQRNLATDKGDAASRAAVHATLRELAATLMSHARLLEPVNNLTMPPEREWRGNAPEALTRTMPWKRR